VITVKTKVFFTRGKSGRYRIGDKQPASQSVTAGRVPRISKLVALAIRFDGLLRDGKLSDLAEIARLSRVTQPRVTQVMNLLHLAPDIQEELLFLPRVVEGRDPVHEKLLRGACAEISWQKQREIWASLKIHAYPVVAH
jgi:hypothetical protein